MEKTLLMSQMLASLLARKVWIGQENRVSNALIDARFEYKERNYPTSLQLEPVAKKECGAIPTNDSVVGRTGQLLEEHRGQTMWSTSCDAYKSPCWRRTWPGRVCMYGHKVANDLYINLAYEPAPN